MTIPAVLFSKRKGGKSRVDWLDSASTRIPEHPQEVETASTMAQSSSSAKQAPKIWNKINLQLRATPDDNPDPDLLYREVTNDGTERFYDVLLPPVQNEHSIQVTLDVLLKLLKLTQQQYVRLQAAGVLRKLWSDHRFCIRSPLARTAYRSLRPPLYLCPTVLTGEQKASRLERLTGATSIEQLRRLLLRPRRSDPLPPLARASSFTLLGDKFSVTYVLAARDLYGVEDFRPVIAWDSARTGLTVRKLQTQFPTLQNIRDHSQFMVKLQELYNKREFEVVRYFAGGEARYTPTIRLLSGKASIDTARAATPAKKGPSRMPESLKSSTLPHNAPSHTGATSSSSSAVGEKRTASTRRTGSSSPPDNAKRRAGTTNLTMRGRPIGATGPATAATSSSRGPLERPPGDPPRGAVVGRQPRSVSQPRHGREESPSSARRM